MERIYILSHIYTSENNASFKNTNLSEMYPYSAGTEDFDRVIKIQQKLGGPTIIGISSVWKLN